MDVFSLKRATVSDIEKLLELYPWYSAARRELFLKMSAMGDEYRKDALHHAVLYLYPDYSVFRDGYVLASAAAVSEDDAAGEYICELDLEFDDMSAPESVEDTSAAASSEAGIEIFVPDEGEDGGDDSGKRIYFVGGDYFRPDELRRVQDQDIHGLSSVRPAGRSGDTGDFDSSKFTDEAFYTETLARIYAEQELYDRANEVYEKLILLYPEKSAYFAALKNDIKKHL